MIPQTTKRKAQEESFHLETSGEEVCSSAKKRDIIDHCGRQRVEDTPTKAIQATLRDCTTTVIFCGNMKGRGLSCIQPLQLLGAGNEPNTTAHPHILAAWQITYLPLLADAIDGGSLGMQGRELLQALSGHESLLSSSLGRDFSDSGGATEEACIDNKSNKRTKINPRCFHGRTRYFCYYCRAASICREDAVRAD